MTPAGRSTLATTHRMIHGVHGNAPDFGPFPHPAFTARFSNGYIGVYRIADLSAAEMDKATRRRHILEMQQIVAQDVPWIPLYNPNIIEAVRTDRFSGWIQMMGGIGNPWSFCVLKPIRTIP